MSIILPKLGALVFILLLGCSADYSVSPELPLELKQARDILSKGMGPTSTDEPATRDEIQAARELTTAAIESGALHDLTLAEAFYWRAKATYRLGQFPLQEDLMQSAIDDLTRSIEIDPENIAYRQLRGGAHSIVGNTALAIKDFSEMIIAEPYAAAFAARGHLYTQLRDYDGAIRDFTSALSTDPSFSYYESRGDAYVEIQEYEKAMEDYLAAEADFDRIFGDIDVFGNSPTEIELGMKLAAAYEGMGEKVKAIDKYESILEKNPDDVEARNRLDFLKRRERVAE